MLYYGGAGAGDVAQATLVDALYGAGLVAATVDAQHYLPGEEVGLVLREIERVRLTYIQRQIQRDLRLSTPSSGSDI